MTTTRRGQHACKIRHSEFEKSRDATLGGIAFRLLCAGNLARDFVEDHAGNYYASKHNAS